MTKQVSILEKTLRNLQEAKEVIDKLLIDHNYKATKEEALLIQKIGLLFQDGHMSSYYALRLLRRQRKPR